jgi:YD repeat-containing protein
MRRLRRFAVVAAIGAACLGPGVSSASATNVFVECPSFKVGQAFAFWDLVTGGVHCLIGTSGFGVTLEGSLEAQAQPNTMPVDFDEHGHVENSFDERAAMLVFPPTEPLRAIRGNLDSTDFTLAYDSHGRLTHLDAAGFTRAVSYDSVGRVSQLTITPGDTSTLTYTPAGQLASVTTPTESVTFTYDPLGRLSQIDGSEFSPWTFDYDAAGELTSYRIVRLGLPLEEDLTYDALGRLATETNVNPYGPTGFASYTYDSAGRIVDASGWQPTPASPFETSITYDAAGNLVATSTSGTFPSTMTFGYDASNRLVTHTDSEGGVGHYFYDSLGTSLASLLRRATSSISSTTRAPRR